MAVSRRWHPRIWLAIAGLPLTMAARPGVAQQTQDRTGQPATQVGALWTRLPEKHTAISVDGTTVYYCDGTYLLPMPGAYLVIPPPFDAVVPEPPSAAVAIVVGAERYWYDRHAFCQQRQDGASCITVHRPLGAVVPTLPEDVSAIAEVSGVRYYMSAGSFSQPVVDADGHTAYVVSLP